MLGVIWADSGASNHQARWLSRGIIMPRILAILTSIIAFCLIMLKDNAMSSQNEMAERMYDQDKMLELQTSSC